MLEKQRQIMEQRQREFEQKRQAQSGATAPAQLAGRPPPLSTARPAAGSNAKTASAPPSPATPLKRQDAPTEIPKLDSAENSRPASNASPGLREQSTDNSHRVPNGGSQNVQDMAMYGRDVTRQPAFNPKPKEPEPLPTALSSQQPADLGAPADIETRARKYTVDQNDLNARRSKNVHDLAMYGKDVTRRASFNPRPKESPFTPEMQAMMKAGHEAMMAAEIEKKTQRINSKETEPALPSFEDEEKDDASKAKAEDAENANDADSSAGKEEEKPKKEQEDFDLDPEEARKRAEAEKAKADAVPGLEDPNLARFLAKDGHDRKSKNIHDLGQYFNRRASYVPDAPGQQRRTSFLPQAGADPTRRPSMLPQPGS